MLGRQNKSKYAICFILYLDSKLNSLGTFSTRLTHEGAWPVISKQRRRERFQESSSLKAFGALCLSLALTDRPPGQDVRLFGDDGEEPFVSCLSVCRPDG